LFIGLISDKLEDETETSTTDVPTKIAKVLKKIILSIDEQCAIYFWLPYKVALSANIVFAAASAYQLSYK